MRVRNSSSRFASYLGTPKDACAVNSLQIFAKSSLAALRCNQIDDAVQRTFDTRRSRRLHVRKTNQIVRISSASAT